jgi:hypothetical protein
MTTITELRPPSTKQAAVTVPFGCTGNWYKVQSQGAMGTCRSPVGLLSGKLAGDTHRGSCGGSGERVGLPPARLLLHINPQPAFIRTKQVRR